MIYGVLRLVGSLKLKVSFAKEPYKRDNILQKRPTIVRSLTNRSHPIRLDWKVCFILRKLIENIPATYFGTLDLQSLDLQCCKPLLIYSVVRSYSLLIYSQILHDSWFTVLPKISDCKSRDLTWPMKDTVISDDLQLNHGVFPVCFLH